MRRPVLIRLVLSSLFEAEDIAVLQAQLQAYRQAQLGLGLGLNGGEGYFPATSLHPSIIHHHNHPPYPACVLPECRHTNFGGKHTVRTGLDCQLMNLRDLIVYMGPLKHFRVCL